MFSALVSLPVMIYLINFILYAATVVAHEGPSFHTTTIYGVPTTLTTTFTPSVSYTPSVTPTPPSYPPTSDTSTYPPTSPTSPTYSPSSSTYTTDTTVTYSSSSSIYSSDSTLTYPPPSSSIPLPTNTSAYPTYTPSYPAPPSQGFANNTVGAGDGRIITSGSGWQTTNSSCGVGGTAKSCLQAGLYLNFTFTGTAVYMWTSLNQNSGTCSVAIDNVTPVQIDGYSPNPACVIAWSAYGLTNGSHTVIVTNLGQSQKATSAGQYNATAYEANGFVITTATQHSASTALMATNSLYLVGTLMVALLASY